MALKNYYHILGIQSNASTEEVKQAYRKLSVKFHPDKNDGDPFLAEMFKSINQANEILSNNEKRKVYDQQLKDAETVANQTDFAKPTPNDYLSVEEEEQVYNQWNLYLEKKKRTDSAYWGLRYARSLDKPQYLTVKKVLVSVLVLLLIWLFLKPTASSETTSTANPSFIIEQNTTVYKKPNNHSNKVVELTKGTRITILGETKYFYKIQYSSGNKDDGYILKGDIMK